MSYPASVDPLVEPLLPSDDIIVLRGATWQDYQRVLEIRGDRAAPRLTYLEGALELMTPSRPHESLKSMIGCLVEAWCFEREVGITPYGGWTHERKDVERAVEPDECYVLGDDADAARADIAIEVIWSSGGLNKLEVYRKLAVREVWIWKKGAIRVFELRDEQYTEIPGSRLLPELDFSLLLRFVDIRPMTRAVKEYRAALRAQD